MHADSSNLDSAVLLQHRLFRSRPRRLANESFIVYFTFEIRRHVMSHDAEVLAARGLGDVAMEIWSLFYSTYTVPQALCTVNDNGCGQRV